MNNNKIMSLLSLCRRSGNLSLGSEACEKALQNGTARLVIIACDASENTKKKFNNKCFFYEVKAVELFTKEDIGKATGSGTTAAITILDEGFANEIIKLI